MVFLTKNVYGHVIVIAPVWVNNHWTSWYMLVFRTERLSKYQQVQTCIHFPIQIQ